MNRASQTSVFVQSSLITFFLILSSCTGTPTGPDKERPPEKTPWMMAETPPMGWNSFNSYGASVTEEEVKANADVMSSLLKEFGWEYIVVDYCWFFPHSGAMGDPDQKAGFSPSFHMDAYGRLFPAPDKFPSSVGGAGFKPLADYVHSKGLKFGIHVMRGIAREAVAKNTQVLGASVDAEDIVNTASTCSFLNAMYGVDMSKEGSQEYYNSLFELYASWGVDYVKVDDLLKVEGGGKSQLHHDEIEAIRNAIDQCGRPMVFSFSPGNNTPLADGDFLAKNTNLWRISSDFWDHWESLKRQFTLCHEWSKHSGPGHWPDADMLSLGRMNRRGPGPGLERKTNFTPDEQKTMLSLWCIFRSPLMMGGDLSVIDKQTRTLMSNPEVLAVNQNSTNNHQLYRKGAQVAWVADLPGSADKYIGFFNIGEEDELLELDLNELGLEMNCLIRDLWARNDLGKFKGSFSQIISPHASGLFRISPQP